MSASNDGASSERRAVSRETVPPPPVAARELFGRSLPLVEKYAERLAQVGTERGLIGPREVPRLWERHLMNSAVVQELVPDRSRVADLGSGAGLPGVVLALVRPDLRVILVEPMLRRVRFLTETVAALELAEVEIVRARAEELVGDLRVDVVTARAVAPLYRLARWSLPLLEKGGRLVAVKGMRARAELEAAEPALRQLNARSWGVQRLGVGVVPESTYAVVVEARS